MGKRMLGKLMGHVRPAKAVTAAIAAFGKHPAHGEHFRIGLDRELLSRFHDQLYVAGIQRNVDQGVWSDGGDTGSLPTFDHWILVTGDRGWIVARAWPSRDQSGRPVYPLVLAAAGAGPPMPQAVRTAASRLGRLWTDLEPAKDIDTVRRTVAASEVRLASDLEGVSGSTAGSPSMTAEPPAGLDIEGFVRVLYRLRRDLAGVSGGSGIEAPGRTAIRQLATAASVRVPCGSISGLDAAIEWGSVLDRIAPGVEHWVVVAGQEPKVDLLVGRVGSDSLTCLGRTVEQSGFASEVPYEIDPATRATLLADAGVPDRAVTVEIMTPSSPPTPPGPPAESPSAADHGGAP